MANIQRRSLPAVPLRPCLVSFTDSRGVQHSVEVTAETLFEAAALGVALLRKDLGGHPKPTISRHLKTDN